MKRYRNEKMAKEIYDNYQSQWQDEKILRVDLPKEFGMMRLIALNSFLNDEMFPAEFAIESAGPHETRTAATVPTVGGYS